MAFQYGIVEGFYGRQWTWPQRFSLPEHMLQWGIQSYVYAPKGDVSLRSHWQDAFSTEHVQNLSQLAANFKNASLSWGLGLSPVGLQAEVKPRDMHRLADKLRSIAQLKPDSLWVLFDDLPAGNPQLAANQLRVVSAVIEQLPDTQIAVCPSYYSFDPILETLFGRRPEGYFEDLHQGLPAEVQLLWTGNKVVSDRITAEDIQSATEALGRAPLLWDNYPVNDGRKTSRFLHLAPFANRSPAIPELCSGHFSNPMNPFSLNASALSTLNPSVGLATNLGGYTGVNAAQSNNRYGLGAGISRWPKALQSLLLRDWQIFQEQGLDNIAIADKKDLIKQYQEIDHPAAVEVCQWLAEEYRFDPNCLTE